MSNLNYDERLAIRNAATLANAQWAYDNRAEPEPRSEDEIAAEADSKANDKADAIIRRIALEVASIDDPRERLARQVGMLQMEIRGLCIDLVWAEVEQ